MYAVPGIGTGHPLVDVSAVPQREQNPRDGTQRVEAAVTSQSKTASPEFKKNATQQTVAFSNTIAELFDTKLSFYYDERIDQVVVKIVEDGTEKVIRQIPPEKMVELVAKFKNDLRGLILNHQG
jgi:flagellar protein FlaG